MIQPGNDPYWLGVASQRLAQGELVAVPTETVYGLGARADSDEAVARIFAAKGRPTNHPVIVHVSDTDSAQRFAAFWPDAAQRLAAAFWPGPLTLIVPRRSGVAFAASGGQDSLGLRCPAHPVAQALLRCCQEVGVWGIAAPSANRFGRISPTSATHVAVELDDSLLVLDGGECEVGIESTIIDCTRSPAVLLRPGMLTAHQIEAVLGQPLGQPDAHSPRASGRLVSHYAPNAALHLMSPQQLLSALALQQARDVPLPQLAVYARSIAQPAGVLWHPMPHDAKAAAHELFMVLRAFDAQGAQRIWVEMPPADEAWAGVRDRLQRAAASLDDASLPS